MADKQMNQFTTATDGAYIYAEAADGSQIKISKLDIISLIRNYTLRGFNNAIDSVPVTDCDSLGGYNNDGEYYISKDTLNAPSFSGQSSILLKRSTGGYFYQECIDVTTGKRWTRYYSVAWSPWKQIV